MKQTTGSGNVFKDLGLDYPEDRLKKAQIASTIYSIIQDRKLTQKEAGKVLGIGQPKVSSLLNGRLEGFSLERLLGFLSKLDMDVEIVAKPKKLQVAAFTFSYKPKGKKLKTAG